MAKRPAPRTQDEPTATGTPARSRRARSAPAAPREAFDAVNTIPESDPDGTSTATAILGADSLTDDDSLRSDERSRDDATRSSSMGSEPSEEDIRVRAYHRYLERGGGHGQDFEDWLEAERELKNSQK